MNQTEARIETSSLDEPSNFSDRLKSLLGSLSVSAFARRVGLSESLVRKYMKGSEPSLSRAEQIARKANVNLEWLATGKGSQFRQTEAVDQAALVKADEITQHVTQVNDYPMRYFERMTLLLFIYNFLLTHKDPAGAYDSEAATAFAQQKLKELMNAYDNVRKKQKEGERKTREE